MDLKLNNKQVKLLNIMCYGAQGDLQNNSECYLAGYEKELNEIQEMVLSAKANDSTSDSGLNLDPVIVSVCDKCGEPSKYQFCGKHLIELFEHERK